MPIPKQRHTSSRRDRRRSHHFLKELNLKVCPHCGKPVLPHTVCSNCGYYRGKQVFDVLAKLDKKQKKEKAKELANQAKETKENKPVSLAELSKK
ncbi:50S ribosomal protein L32 [bacterium]|nr:MAG: 50S ribosomal protein L32 [bacterium]